MGVDQEVAVRFGVNAVEGIKVLLKERVRVFVDLMLSVLGTVLVDADGKIEVERDVPVEIGVSIIGTVINKVAVNVGVVKIVGATDRTTSDVSANTIIARIII